ncbi:MAG: LrgB family protein [Clostridiales bacterium]|nr:LrgB family protein [Clostridiales bacterium]
MIDLLQTPVFGIIISIVAYEIGLSIYRKTKLPIFNPLLIAIIIVIGFLLAFDIDLETYNLGGDFISVFLTPATVILAVPLYNKLEILKKSYKEILIGIALGSTASVISVLLLAKLFNVNESLLLSLIPKSITTPVGVEVSKQLGGIPSITVAAIIITGILGAVLGPSLCRLFKIKDKLAIGIAMGTSSHAVGTTKAIEMGEIEGAMSGLAIGVAALITVLVAPIIVKILL